MDFWPDVWADCLLSFQEQLVGFMVGQALGSTYWADVLGGLFGWALGQTAKEFDLGRLLCRQMGRLLAAFWVASCAVC